jgi:hypothetical protein
VGPDGDPGWDRLAIEGSSVQAVADEVLSFGPDAYAEAPPQLRALVIDRLRAAVA